MGMRIRTNVSSLQIVGRLEETTRLLQRSYARLSTGSRIAVAADDPAGVGIAARMGAELRSLSVAKRNAFDGISLVRVADAALSEVGELLKRSRELGVQAASETLSNEDRAILDGERAELTEEIRRIVDESEYNGILLFGENSELAEGGISIQVGSDAGDVIEIETVGLSRMPDLLEFLDFSTEDRARLSLEFYDAVIDRFSFARGQLGATENRLDSAARTIQTRTENLAAARSRIYDVDYALETAEQTRLQILQESGVAMLAQANASPLLVLRLLGIG